MPRDAKQPLDEHAAFFAEARRDATQVAPDSRALVVPRSYKAAFLAGLVVGCALVGFSVTGAPTTDPFAEIGQAFGTSIDTRGALPVVLLLGLFGGARAAAMTVLPVHGLLTKVEQTSHAAYAAGGALAAVALAGVLLLVLGHAPAHGWPVEIAAGAGCGFLYRVFAGARAA